MAKIKRRLLFDSGDCKFSTFDTDFHFTNVTGQDTGGLYKPGIISTDRTQSFKQTSLTIFPAACEEIITNRNIGDEIFITLIQNDGDERGWFQTSQSFFLLEGLRNLGFSRWELKLTGVDQLLTKKETIMWDDEWAKKKYGDSEIWFDQISSIQDKLFKIKMERN